MKITAYAEKTAEHGTFHGTPEEVVDQMRQQEWPPTPETNEAYMKEVARRSKVLGQKIKYNNEWEFLQELERIGDIEKIEVHEE